MIEHHHNRVYGLSSDYPKMLYNKAGESIIIEKPGDAIPKGFGDYFDHHDKATGAPHGGDLPAHVKTANAGGDKADAKKGDHDLDSDGHLWDAKLHAGTKGKTKDGKWRMNVGVSRPAPMPGFPKKPEFDI